MHHISAEHGVRANPSSAVSSPPSVAGPSTSPSPVLETPAATMNSIKGAGTIILNLIDGWRKKTPTAQALVEVLGTSLTKHEALLNTTEVLDMTTFTCLQDLNNTLREVQRAVKAEVRPRKRHVAKGAIMKLFRTPPPDVFPLCQTRVVEAFHAIERALPVPKLTTPPYASQQGASTPAIGGATTPPLQPCQNDHAEAALDTLETNSQPAVGVEESIPLECIFKAVGSIGVAIIKILNDVVKSKQEAHGLAKNVQHLLAISKRFIEDSGMQIGDETIVKLRAFEATLKSVHGELEAFRAQGGFRQGVSHARNTEVLSACDTQIRRSYAQLEVHLSLDAARHVTKLGDTRQESDWLLDILGDADTGAVDKSSDPADLMCLEGTRVELLEEVDAWASDPSSKRVLWINGVAGCGKSAIAATIASRREEHSATAIFHFSRSNQPRNKRVICSIALQLVKKLTHATAESLEHLVLSSVQTDPNIASLHISAEFKDLIADPLSELTHGSPPILIIIDALDEWDNLDAASKLVHLIHEHNSKLHSSIKFILTGRKESHLSRAFGSPRIASIVKSLALDVVPRATVNQDILTYLVKHFDRIRPGSSEPSAGNWPEPEAIEKLVTLSGGLFQWASTVVRFVENGSHEVRLKEVFERTNRPGDLDALYQLGLTTFLQANDQRSILTLLQHVLGSIVVAPTPISLDTLVYLHTSDQNALKDTTSDIKAILWALGSLLVVPVHPGEPIRVLHPSIIDYLTDQERCVDARLHVDRVVQNRRLALLCLERMQRDLKRDICGISDPRRFNVDADVQWLVSKRILDPLRYVCRYWAEHLVASGVANVDEVDVPLKNFCTGYLLFWFEVMGLTENLEPAYAAIKMTEKWVTQCPASSINPIIGALLHDAWRFLLMYSEPILDNAAHIYLSALATAPSGTHLARTYRDSASIDMRVLAGPNSDYWPSSLRVAEKHSDGVTCCAFSPDGTILASGSEDRTLRLWDVEAGVQRGPTLEEHDNGVSCLAFSSEGWTLASGSVDSTLRLWDVEAGVQKGPTLEGHAEEVTCLAFSPDGTILASGSADNTLRLWDVETGTQRVPTLEGHTELVSCLAFSSDGITLASGSLDKTLRLWHMETGVQKGPTLEGHAEIVTCLAISSDGRTLASGSADNTLRMWDVETGTQKGPTLEGHAEMVTCLAISSDGRTLASGSADNTLRMWDVETGTQSVPTLQGHTDPVMRLAYSPNGEILASGSVDNTLRLWDVETGVQRGPTLEGHTEEVSCLAFSSDGRTLASGSLDKTLRLWDMETEVQGVPTPGGHADSVRCLAFSSDSRALASGSDDDTIRLWDVETGIQRGPTLEGHADWVTCLAFSPNGRTLASGSGDKTLRLWDLETGMQRGHTLSLLRTPTELQFSPSGGRIAINHSYGPVSIRDIGVQVCNSPASPDDSASDTSSSTNEVVMQVQQDGWVAYGVMPWFWLPVAFGRDIQGELRGERFIFHHDRHVCIIDVSDLMYLIQ